MNKLLLIALAGSLGALARYGFSGLVQRWAGSGFPWGTLAVNLAGCFLIAMFWSMAERRLNLSSEVRVIITIGFLGAFTTFSTFAFETGALMREAQWMSAAANVALNNLGGVAMLFAGFAVGRYL